MTASPLPRRILYICHDGDLFGSQQSLLLMISHLPEECQAYVSIARPGPLNRRLEEFPNVKVLPHKRLQWVKHDKRSWFQKIGDVLSLLFSAWPRATKLATYIREHQIELVHTNSVVSMEGALAARLAGIPHLWHVRELFMEKSPKLHMVLGRKLTRWVIAKLSNQVVCNSHAVRDQFGLYAKWDPDKFRVIYNAIDESLASFVPSQPETSPKETSQDNPFVFGYVGRLSAGKRFDDLLEALVLLNRPDCRVVVAGRFVDERYENHIDQIIQKKQLGEKVEFLGYCDDLASVYKQMHALVVPSLNEPFGRVVIEAMLAGVPVLGADSGGIPEIITHGRTGLLFAATDTSTLAKTMAQVMDHPILANQLRKNALREVRERFTLEAHMTAILGCYQSVLSQKG